MVTNALYVHFHEQNPLVGETFSGFLPLLTAVGSAGMLMMKLKDMRMGTFKGMTALDKKVGRTGTGWSSAAGKLTAIRITGRIFSHCWHRLKLKIFS